METYEPNQTSLFIWRRKKNQFCLKEEFLFRLPRKLRLERKCIKSFQNLFNQLHILSILVLHLYMGFTIFQSFIKP
jgi:hypothetical protein